MAADSLFGGNAPKMVDMKRPKESLKPENIGKISPDPYSYDHRISLDADAMNKLGMDTLPAVGDTVHMAAHGHVISSSMNEGVGGKKTKRVEIQLKKMAVQHTPKGGLSTAAPKGGVGEAVNRGIDEANET